MKEGEASIFKPEGCEYQLVARVQMEDWPKLAVAVQAHSWKQRKPACPRVFCQSERVTPAARVHMAAAAKLANVL